MQNTKSTLRHWLCAQIVVILFITLAGCSTATPDNSTPTELVITPSATAQVVPVTSTPTPAPQPSLTPTNVTPESSALEPQLISEKEAKTIHWEADIAAFSFTTWAVEEESILFYPETGEIETYTPKPTESLPDIQSLDVFESMPYQFSPDKTALLYHRKVLDEQFELWYADLNTLDACFVMTTSGMLDTTSFFEEIIWINDGEEALLTRTMGESIRVRRFNPESNAIENWFNSFDQSSQSILKVIAPTHLTLSPDGHKIAMLAWGIGPEQDGLWSVDLRENRIQFLEPACGGIAPFWSVDGQYIYFARGKGPHYFATQTEDDPVGFFKFDLESQTSVPLVPPGDLGELEVRRWSISSDDTFILFKAESYAYPRKSGTWLVKLAPTP